MDVIPFEIDSFTLAINEIDAEPKKIQWIIKYKQI